MKCKYLCPGRLVSRLPVRPFFAAAIAVLFITSATGQAQRTYIWDGGGGAGNQQWSKNNNWAGIGAPPDNTTNIFIFGGTSREFAPENDRTGLAAASVVFATNASTNAQSYNLTGNNLALLGGVTNLSTRWHTISFGLVLATNSVTFDTFAQNLTLAGVVGGSGALVKSGAHTLVLTAANTYAGGTVVTAGAIRGDTRSIRGNLTNNATVIFDQATNGIFAGPVSGTGNLLKTNTGLLTLAGSNNFTGLLRIQAGALELAAANGAAAASAAGVHVAAGATLLVSRNHQVNDAATVTLTGGTILRAPGVGESFGNLAVTQASFLDFGSGAPGSFSFGIYAPSALLTVRNFFPGNVLSFRSNLTATIGNTALFVFDGDFSSAWNADSGVFTVTAIPEPATLAACAGLLCLLLWPSRRVIRDVRSIVGLRRPMRERLEAMRR